MASTRTQQGALLSDSGFLQQVTGSLIAYAYTVLTEGASVTNHANRLAFARAIFLNPAAQAQFMLPGMLTNANISAAAGTPTSIADSDCDSEVSTLFNVYANQYIAQSNIGAVLQVGS